MLFSSFFSIVCCIYFLPFCSLCLHFFAAFIPYSSFLLNRSLSRLEYPPSFTFSSSSFLVILGLPLHLLTQSLFHSHSLSIKRHSLFYSHILSLPIRRHSLSLSLFPFISLCLPCKPSCCPPPSSPFRLQLLSRLGDSGAIYSVPTKASLRPLRHTRRTKEDEGQWLR